MAQPTQSPWEVYQQALGKYAPSNINPNYGYAQEVQAPEGVGPLPPAATFALVKALQPKLGAATAPAVESIAPLTSSGAPLMSIQTTPTFTGAGEAVQSLASGGTGFSSGLSTSGIGPIADGSAYAQQLGAAPVEAGTMTSIAPYLGAAAALHGGYNTFNNISGKKGRKASAMSGAEMGAGIGTMIAPGVGTLVGALLGAGGGALLGNIRSGKSQVQQQRDMGRDALIDSGIIGKDYILNGLDIGRDGGAMLMNQGENIDGKKERHYYDVDFSNPLAKNNVARVSPYVSKILGEDASEKLKSDTVGMLMNALTNNAKTQEDFDRNLSSVFKNLPGANFIKLPGKIAPPRSETKSPGIRKDGTRIDYSRGKA